jgi:hypothetical protein
MARYQIQSIKIDTIKKGTNKDKSYMVIEMSLNPYYIGRCSMGTQRK